MRQILIGARLFDGQRLHGTQAVVVDGGRVVATLPEADAPPGKRLRLEGGVLAPGLIDLQVNGGGGRMVDGSATADVLAEICAAHARLGATGILPTLITDTPEATAAVIRAGIEAARRNVPGFLGLHLEGPHLDPRRKGAHDPRLIRPMDQTDLERLCDAARQLPALMVTLAPVAASAEQIKALRAAGAIVSLGHAEATSDEARQAIAAGANCATHLFNAMSQLGNREPGMVGTILTESIPAGLIADSIHVHPAAMRIAMAASPQSLFLVSDAMCVAGSDLTEFTLGGRRILRRQGRLTLEDGTLAGADLTLPDAIHCLITEVGVAPEIALAMATSRPARIIAAQARAGSIGPGRLADLVHLTDDWRLGQVWQGGQTLL
ncbi:N-acetylglucosamine-6-phosphate deacetylase [Tabrizicola sp. J26]|uniref:N-acetylglucosamine-6-phosphate deacetylase n=1 Tax=Alitabrizicola rongguiensis TaxID=2909234 RepID=UPI001F3AE794|nr:N-acetylglucosamine-6-phosphate deacetylase [Tabrizicola rongguiensis]MCF1710632.1 N-acetylglucosamine-6-phosphate deacetylase [Tabrizicola rongguiensis]